MFLRFLAGMHFGGAAAAQKHDLTIHQRSLAYPTSSLHHHNVSYWYITAPLGVRSDLEALISTKTHSAGNCSGRDWSDGQSWRI